MALTNSQNIPDRPKASEPWTINRLLSFGAIKTLSSVFVNPFDILLGYLILIFGIAELLNVAISIFFWILTVLILATCIFERNKDLFFEIKTTEKK